METDDSFVEADARNTLQSFRRGSVLSAEAEAKYQGFLSSPRGKVLFQGGLLLAALSAYTLGPLLVSWSTMVRVPDAARFVTIVPAPRPLARPHEWYGVELGYQPGNRILYVVKVLNNSLAKSKGVLPGDVVARAWQGDRQIWPLDSKSEIIESQEFIDLIWYLETEPMFGEEYNMQKIDATQPLSVNFDMTHVEVSNSRHPYFPLSITCIKYLLGLILLSAISAAQDKDNIRLIFNVQSLRVMMIPSCGGAVAEVFEILANSNMNPALYSVLSQSRILATAVCMRLLLGTKQTQMQSLILVSVSMVIFAYVQVPDYVGAGKFWNGFGDPQDVVGIEDGAEATREVQQSGVSLGMVYAFVKIFLSVVIGVATQKAMGHPQIKRMDIVTTQATFFAAAAIPVSVLTYSSLLLTGWDYGFFGGATVEFRHCVKEWPRNECLSANPVAYVAQGWDDRTLAVALFYICRSAIVNSVLKVFDALVRTMVNAAATLLTYLISLALLGTRFNVTKCVLICSIMLQFVQYSIAPKYVEPAPIEPVSNTVELNNNARSST